MTVQQPNLRPLNAGEILDRAFRLYRANFSLFAGISGILLVPLGIVEVVTKVFFGNSQIALFIESIIEISLDSLLYSALTWAASQIYFGIMTSVNEAYQTGIRRFRSLLGVFFLIGLAFGIPAIFLVIFLTVLDAIGVSVSVVLILPLVVLCCVFIFVRWGVFIPAIVIEDLGARAGLKRSWSLTSKDSWHVFGTLVTSFLLIYLVASLPGVAIFYAIKYGFLPETMTIIPTILGKIVLLISTPLSSLANLILYYDLRVRREAYDLELTMQATANEPVISSERDLPNPK